MPSRARSPSPKSSPRRKSEAAQTVKVMGGEDWELWIPRCAMPESSLAKAVTVAYSYVGPELSWPIYRDGTIGAAKGPSRGFRQTALRFGPGRAQGLRIDKQGPRHEGERGHTRHTALCFDLVQSDEGTRDTRRAASPRLTRLFESALQSVPPQGHGPRPMP